MGSDVAENEIGLRRVLVFNLLKGEAALPKQTE